MYLIGRKWSGSTVIRGVEKMSLEKKMRIAVWGNIATQLNVLWEIAEFKVCGFEPGSDAIIIEEENLLCLKFEKSDIKETERIVLNKLRILNRVEFVFKSMNGFGCMWILM
jgi:hypothetical protein